MATRPEIALLYGQDSGPSAFERLSALANARDSRALNREQLTQARMKTGEMENSLRSMQALGDAVRQNTFNGQTDHQAVIQALAQSGQGTQAVKYIEDIGRADEATRKAEAAKWQAESEKKGILARIFQSANDPQSWERAKQEATRLGLPASPESFSPQARDMIVNAAMTAKEHADYMRNIAADQRDQQRHDAEMAGTIPTDEVREFRQVFLPGYLQKLQSEGFEGPPSAIQEVQAWDAFKQAGQAPPKPTFQELTYQDYLKSPEAAQFGASRVGFEKWQQQQRIDTTIASRPDKPDPAPRPATGAQTTAMRYYLRMENALNDIDSVESQVKDMNTGGQLWLEWAPNMLQGQVGQTYNTASKQFTEARLRKDSGAAIPPHEYEADRKMYFAQPGDTPETLEQKKRARQIVLDGIKQEAGRAYADYYGEQEPSAPQGPRVGETRDYQGATYVFDGNEWVRQ